MISHDVCSAVVLRQGGFARWTVLVLLIGLIHQVVVFGSSATSITDASPLREKAPCLLQDLLNKHWLDGLYVGIVPATPPGEITPHTVDQPGNVIHSGVWTGRYLAGVGYEYAVTHDAKARERGGQILKALHIQQMVTGKPGLLARGYMKGHGPVEGWERNGADSIHWHQGQGAYAGYRWYGDVSVDNFNAVLYGYAIYFDLAADAAQRKQIAEDVDRLMTHVLENHCRIIDVTGEVTQWGHIGIDPDPARDEYYQKRYAARLSEFNQTGAPWQPSLRSSLMLLPDLLIAHHLTGKASYLEFYQRVVKRFKDNPDRMRDRGPFSLERLARVNHSSEGQSYEALYNLIRYEHDPALLAEYRRWTSDLWEMNWMEGNPLFTWMTLALLPEYRAPSRPGVSAATPAAVPHGDEAWRLSRETLHLYPVDRVLHPVMNSLRADLELNPFSKHEKQSAKVIPINQRPLDNEYAWKGSPYELDGWLKPAVTQFQLSCDDPMVAWFCDSNGRLFLTRDGGKDWQDVSCGLVGARVSAIAVSTNRTFVLHARTDQGLRLTRDGGLSWRAAPEGNDASFAAPNFQQWQKLSHQVSLRIDEQSQLVRSPDDGKTSATCMTGWRIPRANSLFVTSWGILAGGSGGFYRSTDGIVWTEMKLWPELETGPADFLHAYWMGRYYGFLRKDE
jgi:hypothetical protein